MVEAGELALLRSRWTLRSRESEGQPMELAGERAEVVQQQADGSWRFVINHPFAELPAQAPYHPTDQQRISMVMRRPLAH